MKRLPFELQVDIFNRLVFKDKLQCALVCREWYTTINRSVLYSKICFKLPQVQAKARIKTMHDAGLGHQILDLRMRELSDPLELSLLCPKLRSLQVDNWKSYDWNDSNNAFLAQNWKRLEKIKEGYSHTLLTFKLFDTSMCIKSLTFLSVCLYDQFEDVIWTLIAQLKNAPSLKHLILEEAFVFNYEMLDLLHENIPNLKHLSLLKTSVFLVQNTQNLEEYHPLFMNTSVASNLLSFCVTFESTVYVAIGDNFQFTHHTWEINGMYWIEYICRKYTNLKSITIRNCGMLISQHNEGVVKHYLQEAFGKWTRLEKLDILPVFLSVDIFRAIDKGNICIKELSMYVYNETDMEQFINLAKSRQGRNVQTLIVDEDMEEYYPAKYMIFYLQSLNKNNCQLKTIHIRPNKHRHIPNTGTNMICPNQILARLPYLQSLSMPMVGSTRIFHTKYSQKSSLTHLDLELYHLDNEAKLHIALHIIQDIIFNSPFLLSSSLLFPYDIYDVSLDFQQNTKLKTNVYRAQLGDVFKVVQNNQTKKYAYRSSEYNPEIYTLKQISHKYDRAYRISLLLPPSIRSLYINNSQCPI